MKSRVAVSNVARADDAYLPLKELAAYTGLSVRTLRGYLRHAPSLPFYRVAGKILVRRSEYDTWIQQFRNVHDAPDLGTVVDDIVNSFSR